MAPFMWPRAPATGGRHATARCRTAGRRHAQRCRRAPCRLNTASPQRRSRDSGNEATRPHSPFDTMGRPASFHPPPTDKIVAWRTLGCQYVTRDGAPKPHAASGKSPTPPRFRMVEVDQPRCVANYVDADGPCGSDDNCPLVDDPNQADAGGDTRGDGCDPDMITTAASTERTTAPLPPTRPSSTTTALATRPGPGPGPERRARRRRRLHRLPRGPAGRHGRLCHRRPLPVRKPIPLESSRRPLPLGHAHQPAASVVPRRSLPS